MPSTIYAASQELRCILEAFPVNLILLAVDSCNRTVWIDAIMKLLPNLPSIMRDWLMKNLRPIRIYLEEGSVTFAAYALNAIVRQAVFIS